MTGIYGTGLRQFQSSPQPPRLLYFKPGSLANFLPYARRRSLHIDTHRPASLTRQLVLGFGTILVGLETLYAFGLTFLISELDSIMEHSYQQPPQQPHFGNFTRTPQHQAHQQHQWNVQHQSYTPIDSYRHHMSQEDMSFRLQQSDQLHQPTTEGWNFHNSKRRPREEDGTSPTSSEGDTGWMQHSFKRLKVMEDEGDIPQGWDASQSKVSSFLPSTTVVSQQTAGEQSFEPRVPASTISSSSSPSTTYQSMNSMLGNLHLMRRHRTAATMTEQSPSQPSSMGMDHLPSYYASPSTHPQAAYYTHPPTHSQGPSQSTMMVPPRYQHAKKKSTSLRINSKLF